MKLLIILLWPCVCVAQLPVVPFVTQTPVSLSVPQQILGLAAWWVHTDAGNTNASVSSWKDRIQGIILTNGDSGNLPTNSALGMGFGAKPKIGLTNIQFLINTNFTVVAIARQTPTGTEPWCTICSENNSNFASLMCPNPTANNLAIGYVDETLSGLGITPVGCGNAYVLNGQSNELDLCMVYSNTSPTTSTVFGYTNGHLMGFCVGNVINQHYFGAVSFNANFILNTHTNEYQGYIREIMVYTNMLTPLNVSNIHYYRTNTYGP